MNQGATEFLLAMGLEDSMVGTAYLDDYIWPAYEDAYNSIPVLSSGYPNETQIMDQNPDFIIGSYNSAFQQRYWDESRNDWRGIFSDETVGPCTGEGAEWESTTTCRPQLHDANISTFLFQDHCEDTSLRPEVVTEETVYEELRALGSIFNVDAEALIEGMVANFDAAQAHVDSVLTDPLTVAWLDCIGCCSVEDGEEPELFVGGGTGAPHMLMQEAGMANLFEDKEGGWVCVKESEFINASPDIVVVVDASWDSASDKLLWLYNHSEFCNMDALVNAHFVTIPFSATTLSPRNGPAAFDLAVTALYVNTGEWVDTLLDSGVQVFDTADLDDALLACNSLDSTSAAVKVGANLIAVFLVAVFML